MQPACVDCLRSKNIGSLWVGKFFLFFSFFLPGLVFIGWEGETAGHHSTYVGCLFWKGGSIRTSRMVSTE